MITVGLWLVGRAVLSQRRIAARLRIRAFELESEQERFAEEAVRYERDRMARELHDVIGHSVSIMVIQASAGQRLTVSDAGAAEEMLGNIAGLAREASADIAGLTRLLLPVQDEPVARAQIEKLLARTAKTGVRIEVVNQPAPAGAAGLGDLGSGRGLAGLAERAAAVGGTFASGPAPAGGWRLSAALPG
jgi:signal transduction histidine kinase